MIFHYEYLQYTGHKTEKAHFLKSFILYISSFTLLSWKYRGIRHYKVKTVLALGMVVTWGSVQHRRSNGFYASLSESGVWEGAVLAVEGISHNGV